jgi:hypothetical protein
MGGRAAGEVRRRRVFYLPGFDPAPARRYREIYRREGAAQAAISGYELALVPGGGRPGGGWSVAARIEGQAVAAEVSVLGWADIVQRAMAGSIAATYGQLLRTAWVYGASGALWRLARLRKGPVIAAGWPVAALLAQLAVALGVAAAVGSALAAWVHGAAAGLGLLAVPVVLRRFRRADGAVMAWYLMHEYAFTAEAGGAWPPVLGARLAAMAEEVRAALAEDWDEVLVVGHSAGAHLAVSVVAEVLRGGGARDGGPALALLTLGQVIPMVSFLPRAERLRADLRLLAARGDLTWVDVSAPGDGCAFALCDPVAVSGVAPADKRWPLVISAAFRRTLSPARWRTLRWRFHRLHFQYLHAFDRPGDYDYFRITAGPRTLAARFAGRAPSRSRIEQPASGHTSLAA